MKLKLGGSKKKKKSKRLGERMSTKVKDKKRKKKKSSITFVKPTSKEAQKRLEEDTAGALWKPKEGTNRVVMLPSTAEMGIGKFPWVEARSHFVGGADAMAAVGIERPDDYPIAHGCAKFHEKRSCGWCAFQEKLRKSRHARDRKLARALFANLSCFANIVDLKQPNIVRQYRFGRTVENELLVAFEDGTNFVDPDDLMEIRIRKIKTGKQDWNVDYKVNILSDRKKRRGPIKQKWIAGMEDLSKFIHHVPSPDEIQETMDLLLAAAEAEGEDIGLEESDYDDSDDDEDDSSDEVSF